MVMGKRADCNDYLPSDAAFFPVTARYHLLNWFQLRLGFTGVEDESAEEVHVEFHGRDGLLGRGQAHFHYEIRALVIRQLLHGEGVREGSVYE